LEFGPDQTVAFALAGTVALPSPFPATGRVSIGLFPPRGFRPSEKAKEEEFEPSFLLKIVQLVNEKHIVTRFVRPKDLRAVRSRPEERPRAELPAWTIQTAAEVSGRIEEKKRILIKDFTKGGPAEDELFAEAIVYVPESAPVLHRLDIGMTAAESAEFCPEEPRCPLGAVPPCP
jgi:hypothetical protein